MVKVQRLFAKTNLKVPVCRTYRTITQKCLQLELPTENSVYSQENRNRAGNYAHLTSENGKLAALTSGRPAFQQHTEHAEGNDTTPRLAHSESPERRVYKPQLRQKRKRSRSPAEPRRLRAATRISASLLRRLSAFFRSVSDQDPKAAKLAVLIPGPGMLVNVRNAPRVVIPPPSETPPVSACKPLCAIFLRKPSVYPLSLVKANVGRLWEKLKNAMKSGLGRSCSGNFLAIFAGTLLDEKPNFLSRIFGRGRPFDFSTR